MFEDSKNPFLRKGEAATRRARKRLLSSVAPSVFPTMPPILVNSFPKSGTHLLSQVVSGLPSDKVWGEFYVSTPSLTMREVPSAVMARRLRRLVPGETAKGHIYWSAESAQALVDRGAATYFIYRDPRDVALSEAHYLTHMNKRHRLHPMFARQPNDAARLMLSIVGNAGHASPGYCGIGDRFARYQGWLSEADVFAVRFEDLRGEAMPRIVEDIVDHYLNRWPSTSRPSRGRDDLVAKCISSIDPQKSHTFHRGGTGGWRAAFSAEHKEAFKSVAGQTLIDLGYERDLSW